MSEARTAMDPDLTLIKDWDFNHGKKVQAEVLHRFNSAVHHPSSSIHGCFFLLTYFRRSIFRLTEQSVSWALHSILGGSPAGFHVHFESDRHFRFSVASKDVGFFVHALNRITTKHFDVYFHLWRDGGANWKHEYSAWNIEEAKQWTTVSYKKEVKQKRPTKRVSFAYRLVQDSPIKKSSPVLAPPTIKVGDLLCPIIAAKQKVKFGGQFSNSNSSIQSKKVFNRLKQDLCMDNEAVQSSSCTKTNVVHSEPQPHVLIAQEKILPSQLMPSKQCFKCLAWGHIARLCTSPLRCKFCFGYFHLARNCFKRKSKHRQIWKKRSCSKKSNSVNSDNWATSVAQTEVELPAFCDISFQQGEKNQGGQGQNIQTPSSAPSVQPSDEPQCHKEQKSAISNEDTTPVQSSSTPPITKVYYRKNPKGRTEKKNDQLEQKRTPILYEPAEDYTIVDDHLDAQENSGTTSSQANDNLEPIVIDRAILQTYLTPTLAITGLEIVPWKPVLSALALQLWPAILASRKATRVQPSTSTVIILPSPRVEQVPATFKPSGFKFQSEKMQPSLLPLPEASSNLIMPLVESSVKCNSRICTSMSLPDAPSNSATPLVDNSVRRSSRLSAKDGFHEVRLAGNPSKKRKTRPVLLVEPMGQARPIPIEILQGWGIDCGVAPGELSQEALMQAPSSDLPVTQ